MPKIEGGVHIKSGEELPEKVKKVVRLPFKAKGWREAKKKKKEEKKPEPKKEETKLISFEGMKGVGKELAEELERIYIDVETFKEKATREELIDISGIGKARAEKLLEYKNK